MTPAFAAMLAGIACSPSSSDGGVETPVPKEGMLEIPASSFLRGCDSAVESYCEGEPDADVLLDGPMRSVWISTFWIDQYEVTI